MAEAANLARRGAILAPVRVGMDRKTGKVLMGWEHVQQSMLVIIMTRYHDRVLRRWVGSFVPHILGESATPRVITRFFWAICSSLELWEPNYRISKIHIEKRDDNAVLTSAEELRAGHMSNRLEGVYRPRGHLGDFTPERRRGAGLVRRASGLWESGR